MGRVCSASRLRAKSSSLGGLCLFIQAVAVGSGLPMEDAIAPCSSSWAERAGAVEPEFSPSGSDFVRCFIFLVAGAGTSGCLERSISCVALEVADFLITDHLSAQISFGGDASQLLHSRWRPTLSDHQHLAEDERVYANSLISIRLYWTSPALFSPLKA